MYRGSAMRRIWIFLCFALCVGETSLQAGSSFFSINPLLSYRPYELHWAAAMDYDRNILELEDGSQWKISDGDYLELVSWGKDDIVEISPNYFSYSYSYYMTNKDTGSYVRANLVNAPLRDSPYAVTITGMDYRRSFSLSNGSSWEISTSDLSLVRNWYVDDLVIIGNNNEWFSFYSHILINIHTNTYIRVQKI